MKVTAILSDDLIEKVKRVSGGKNITESLNIALNEYLQNKQVNYLIDEIDQNPLMFKEDATPYNIRKINREK